MDQYERRRMNTAYFNQWIDNEFREGLLYQPAVPASPWVGYSGGRSVKNSPSILAVGNRFVGNRLEGNTFLAALGKVSPTAQTKPPSPAGRDVIFEHNLVRFSTTGIEVDSGQWFSLLRGNRFSGVRKLFRDNGYETKVLEVAPTTEAAR